MTVPIRWLLVLLPIMVGTMSFAGAFSQTMEQVEFLDGIEEGHAPASNIPYVIGTTGYWVAGPQLSVSVVADGDVRSGALDEVRNFVSNQTLSNSTTFTRWNELLSSFPSAPTLKLASGEEDVNIKIILTESAHPDGKMGKTRISAIKSVRQILSAEVYVYSANIALEQGILDQVVAHELGHALGLSHSNDPDSIMFSLLEVEDGSVANHIGSCEEHGISLLYEKSKIGNIEC